MLFAALSEESYGSSASRLHNVQWHWTPMFILFARAWLTGPESVLYSVLDIDSIFGFGKLTTFVNRESKDQNDIR